MTSLYTLLQELAHGISAGSGLLPTVLGRTTAKGTVSTMIDGDRLLYDDSDVNLLDGRWVYLHRITGTATAGAAATLTTNKDFLVNELADFTLKVVGGTGAGQTRTVISNTVGPNTVITVSAWTTQPDATSEYELYPASGHARISRVRKALYIPTSGQVTLSPPMQATVESGADYSLHLLNPAFFVRAIGWALGRMKYRALLPIGWIKDGDMEDEGTDHWALEGTLAVTKEDITDSEIGRQRLKVVADVHAQGVNSDEVLVTAGEPYTYAALLRVESGVVGSVDVILTDVDGSDFETVNLEPRQFVEVRVSGSIPIGCERIRADFVSNGGACTFYVIYSSLLFPNRDRVALDRFDNRGQILEVLRLPSGPAAVVADTYLRASRQMESVYFTSDGDARAGRPVTVTVDAWEAPLFVRGNRSFPALTLDEEVTGADEDAVLAGARVYLWKQLADGELLAGTPEIVSVLKATQDEDQEIWDKAVVGSGGGFFTRIRGLRKYQAG